MILTSHLRTLKNTPDETLARYGCWIAEVLELPGVLAYGQTPHEARAKVQALALRVLAERLEHGEMASDLVSVLFAAARVNGPPQEPVGCFSPPAIGIKQSSRIELELSFPHCA